MSDTELVLDAATRIESLLIEKFGAQGSMLGRKIDSLAGRVPETFLEQLRQLSRTRNSFAHARNDQPRRTEFRNQTERNYFIRSVQMIERDIQMLAHAQQDQAPSQPPVNEAPGANKVQCLGCGVYVSPMSEHCPPCQNAKLVAEHRHLQEQGHIKTSTASTAQVQNAVSATHQSKPVELPRSPKPFAQLSAVEKEEWYRGIFEYAEFVLGIRGSETETATFIRSPYQPQSYMLRYRWIRKAHWMDREPFIKSFGRFLDYVDLNEIQFIEGNHKYETTINLTGTEVEPGSLWFSYFVLGTVHVKAHTIINGKYYGSSDRAPITLFLCEYKLDCCSKFPHNSDPRPFQLEAQFLCNTDDLS